MIQDRILFAPFLALLGAVWIGVRAGYRRFDENTCLIFEERSEPQVQLLNIVE